MPKIFPSILLATHSACRWKSSCSVLQCQSGGESQSLLITPLMSGLINPQWNPFFCAIHKVYFTLFNCFGAHLVHWFLYIAGSSTWLMINCRYEFWWIFSHRASRRQGDFGAIFFVGFRASKSLFGLENSDFLRMSSILKSPEGSDFRVVEISIFFLSLP